MDWSRKDPSNALEGQAIFQGLQDDRGAFVVAAESTRMAMFFMDAQAPDHVIIFANDSFLRMTGYAREEVLGQPLEFLLVSDDEQDSLPLKNLEIAFTRDTDGELELCFRRKDASIFHVDIFITAVRDKSGALVQHFASIIDLTRHKRAQKHARMMIDELNHRVKNTLATVQSIVRQALRQNSPPSEIQVAIESRIFALSRSHNLLTRTSWDGAKLLDLVRTSVEPFAVIDGRTDRISIDGPDITLMSSMTVALGIALHELATNAVKYGALSNAEGSIAIDWTYSHLPDGDDELVIDWKERGGPTVTAPTVRGFGSKVIERGLPHELGGSALLDFQREGLVCTVKIPMGEGNPRG
jgi:PAS domain S-box-containing protein